MQCIVLEGDDPARHLAAEEAFLRHSKEDTLLLWRSRPAVVIGRHQVPGREANLAHLHNKGIPLLRRLSGGGTVYHDPGSLNFAFIRDAGDPPQVDYATALQPILKVLHAMGIPAEFHGKSDLFLHGRKISGNAIYIHKRRLLHHGTLLFEADLKALQDCLQTHPERYQSRSIRSTPSPVTNIQQHNGSYLSIAQFSKAFLEAVHHNDSALVDYTLTHNDADHIERYTARYRFDDWTYASSPHYSYDHTADTPLGKLGIHLDVDKGRITTASILGPEPQAELCRELSQALQGRLHMPEDVLTVLATCATKQHDADFNPQAYLGLFF